MWFLLLKYGIMQNNKFMTKIKICSCQSLMNVLNTKYLTSKINIKQEVIKNY